MKRPAVVLQLWSTVSDHVLVGLTLFLVFMIGYLQLLAARLQVQPRACLVSDAMESHSQRSAWQVSTELNTIPHVCAVHTASLPSGRCATLLAEQQTCTGRAGKVSLYVRGRNGR